MCGETDSLGTETDEKEGPGHAAGLKGIAILAEKSYFFWSFAGATYTSTAATTTTVYSWRVMPKPRF